MGSQRQNKMASKMKELLAAIINKVDIRGISIIEVKMSADLRYADIEVAAFQPDLTSEYILKKIEAKKNHLKQLLKPHITNKYMPELRFFSDKHSERIKKMEDLLEKIAN